MRAAILFALITVACSSGDETKATTDATPEPEEKVFGGDRPVPLFRAPEGHDPKVPLPLVMILHGYGAGGLVQSLYFRLEKLVNEKKFLLVAPDGTVNKSGSRFWNAVTVCCDFDSSGVDDVKYLTGLVDEIGTVHAIDKKRVYLLGHSNGGAMAYRLACDAAPKFAAVITLAPPFYDDMSKCNPTDAVAIRHMHGTADETVPYAGGKPADATRLGAYPSARSTAEAWAKWNGCGATPDESAPPIDFDRKVAGAETKVSTWNACRGNSIVELWTMEGSTHIPADLAADLPDRLWSFFAAHPKP
jgi:polyhydroxybutyrate depolymerase